MPIIAEIVEELKALPQTKKDLRNMGLVFLVALGIIGGIVWYKGGASGPWLVGIGVAFGLWGIAWPNGLKPVHKAWMALAVTLGYFISRLLLTIIFYLVLTPIGLIMRALGKDLIDKKMRDRESYWHIRDDEYDPVRTEKMY